MFSTFEGHLWYARSRYVCGDMTFKSACKWADALYIVVGTDEYFNSEVVAYVLHLRQNTRIVKAIHRELRKLGLRALELTNRDREAEGLELLAYTEKYMAESDFSIISNGIVLAEQQHQNRDILQGRGS